MKRPREILTGTLCVTILATVFCVWTALGNDVNFCISAGCHLYQDFTVQGISLWWLGTGVFTTLSGLALLGLSGLGKWLSALALFGDCFLLLLMATTVPCTSCLIVAIFFVFAYLCFRQADATIRRSSARRFSVIVFVWFILFTLNMGDIAKTFAGTWPILKNSDDTSINMFFTPSCSRCREGIEMLSGRLEVAFYPLAESEEDIYKIAQMERLLDSGMNMVDALRQSQDVSTPKGMALLTPSMMALRFRLLRNKAHVFASGGQAVPFFEIVGLPEFLVSKGTQKKNQPSNPLHSRQNAEELALEPIIAGQCGSGPCQ